MRQRKAPTPEERALGERLRHLREARGLRVCDVSRKLDMSDQNWLLYEKGDNAFKLLMLKPLAGALGMESRELWEELKPVADSVSFSAGLLARTRNLLGAVVSVDRQALVPSA